MSSHGTTRAYRLGCRCDECKAAKKTAASAERQRRQERVLTGQPPPPPGRPRVPLSERPHGSYVTYSKGCRCRPCTEANSDYGRERKAERELAQWELTGVLEP